MLSIDELRDFMRLKGLKTLGNAEKDYLIELSLLSLSRSTKDELVFKGGTCLSKFYGLDRFSEDIDFTVRKSLDASRVLKGIVSDLNAFGIDAEIKEERKAHNTIMAIIRTRGPLFQGTQHSVSGIKLDMNLKSSIDLEPEYRSYSSLYPNVPAFSMLVMQEKEILAEKVRAIMTRGKARDVYDLRFLLERGVQFDEGLVRKKLEYYGEKWSPKKFSEGLRLRESVWKTELGPLVGRVPDFGETRKLILEGIKD